MLHRINLAREDTQVRWSSWWKLFLTRGKRGEMISRKMADEDALVTRSEDGRRRTTSEVTHKLFQEYANGSSADESAQVTISELIHRHRLSTIQRIRALQRQLDTCFQSLESLRQANYLLQEQNQQRLMQSSISRSRSACRG